jgi:hypothetical protein
MEERSMKRALTILLELVAFLVLFLGGSLLPEFKVLPKWSIAAGPNKIFVLDGLLLMLSLYVLLLLIAVMRKRIRFGWQNPTIALVLALIVGLLSKFGFQTIGG